MRPGVRDRHRDTYGTIYAVVRRIPRGRVATYGQVAALAGRPGGARQVGYALHALRDASGVPWHRVINARGAVSNRSEPGAERQQRARLEAEGLVFDGAGRIDLGRWQWRPRSSLSRAGSSGRNARDPEGGPRLGP